MRLDGRRVLITGAGSGIGRALAIGCAAKGAHLILAGRRQTALDETIALLPAGHPAIAVPADIASAGGRAALHRAAAAQGALDVLINNAGVVQSGALEMQSDVALEHLFAVNVLAPIALVRDLLPLLRAAEQPRVVSVGSVFGDIGHPLFAAYGASKFALRGFSDAMRRELAGEGIGVTYAAPRATHTPAAEGFADLVEPFAMTMDNPEVVAAEIIRAIERGAPMAYPRGLERLFVWIQRLFPGLIDQALSRKYQAWRSRQSQSQVRPPAAVTEVR
tara:strand:+ start:532 stop:1359 length:828 start_codon:yes stop_codon:yes gene_type:complete